MNLRPLAAVAVIFLASPAAYAASGEDLIAAIGKCASLADDSARLACYDKIAAQAKTVAAAPVVAAQPVALPPSKEQEESWFGIADWFGSDKASPAEQTTPQQFGSESLPPPPAAPGAPPAEPLDSITVGVADFAYNPFGRFTVFLDNGQIWQQLSGDTDKARFSKNKKNQVTISRGALGSYNLVIDDHASLYKVKRIK